MLKNLSVLLVVFVSFITHVFSSSENFSRWELDDRQWEGMPFGTRGGLHEAVEIDFLAQLKRTRSLLKRVDLFRTNVVDEDEELPFTLQFENSAIQCLYDLSFKVSSRSLKHYEQTFTIDQWRLYSLSCVVYNDLKYGLVKPISQVTKVDLDMELALCMSDMLERRRNLESAAILAREANAVKINPNKERKDVSCWEKIMGFLRCVE